MNIIELDATHWARFPEVVKFSEVHGLSIDEAIIALVNSALSSEPRSYL